MYADPSHLRDHEVKVRFDEATMDAINGLAVLTRKQRAVFVRDLVLSALKSQFGEASCKAAANGRA